MIIKNLDTEKPEELQKYFEVKQPNSELFQEIEKRLNDYIEEAPPSLELKEKFFSSDAIYTFKGCVIEQIENIFNLMNEENLNQINLNDPRIDLFCDL